MDSEKVSIIIPVYNVENYVERCILSICNQSYKNIEIIVIDDGSTDNSGSICQKLSLKDNRIVLIHKKNEGVSNARNNGLSLAKGKYILFVDGDDYIGEEYVSKMVNLIKTSKTECAISLDWNGDSIENNTNDLNNNTIKSSKAIEMIYLNKIHVAVWNKIYSKSFLEKNIVKFNEEFWFAEGMTFNIECFSKLDFIGVGKFKEYFQVYNPNSATRKFNLSAFECSIRALEYQKQFWKGKNDGNIRNAWNYHLWNNYLYIIIGLTEEKDVDKSKISEYIGKMRKHAPRALKANLNLKNKIKILLIFLFPKLMTRIKIRRKNKYISKNKII